MQVEGMLNGILISRVKNFGRISLPPPYEPLQMRTLTSAVEVYSDAWS